MDTASRSNGKKNGKGNNAKPFTEQDISWLEESCDKTPVAFFDKFGIHNSEEGHRRYATAVRRSALREKERTLLIDNFEAWKKSEALMYWECQNTKAIANKSAWKTAGNMIKGSKPFVETIITENASEKKQHSAVPSDAPHISKTPDQTSDTLRFTSSAKSAGKDFKLIATSVTTYNGNAVDPPSEETKDAEKDPVPLGCADCMEARGLCLMPELELKDEEFTKLLHSLKTSKTRKLNAVLEDVYSWLISKPIFRLFLLVLRNIIENILNPHHGDNKPSECDALLIWGSILKDGRPMGTPFTYYLGELASLATRVSKSLQADEYYHEYAVDAKDKIDIFNYTRNTVGQEEEEESKGIENESDLEGTDWGDLNEEIEIIDWNDFIFHTPTKPRVTRTNVPKDKPNNQRFQQRVQDAMAEHKHDDNDNDDENEDVRE
ncbi:hypothetical protein BGZ95_005460 [Linnemannia exigua]|uniref:Uncharacterized protein n=1 Tax=Linnemannia exigua TaxID=604196 RepID=A0AAD4H098_9FUNG|nr:hypothetical protein BGZ95_005460 [Linnemannia exigua]